MRSIWSDRLHAALKNSGRLSSLPHKNIQKDCETFYRHLEKKQEMSGKTGRYQYIFQSLTIGTIAVAVAFVIAAGMIHSWIMAFFLNRGKEDGSLIDYMMNLLSDVVFFGTPVKNPDV